MKTLYVDAQPVARVDSDNPYELWDWFKIKYDYATWEFRSARIVHSKKLMEKDGLQGNTPVDMFIDWLNKRGIKAEKV